MLFQYFLFYSYDAENVRSLTGFVVIILSNMSQNRIFSSLFFCYALNLLFKKFLGAYKMCVFLLHKYMSSKKLVFKILRSFHFFPFYIKGNWVLHDFVGLCLPKYISPETFCCLSFFFFFFLIDLYLWIMNILVCKMSHFFVVVCGRYASNH